jgi:hypothetical protein
MHGATPGTWTAASLASWRAVCGRSVRPTYDGRWRTSAPKSKARSALRFDVVDVLELAVDGRIRALRIVYDTAVVRPIFEEATADAPGAKTGLPAIEPAADAILLAATSGKTVELRC